MFAFRQDDPDDPYPIVDQPSCRLLGPVALLVQGAMGVIVIGTLVYKRHRESPKRPWRIWLFDVSKQIVGQMFVHGLNVLISDVVARLSSGNACVFYFLNILIDTTLGIAIIYFMLHAITSLLAQKFRLKGFESGKYGDPPSIKYWTRQAAVYVLSISTMKLAVIALFALFPGIFEIGKWLLSWTGEGSNFQIVFTMGLFPIFMNCLQFWLIDSIVKASTPPLTLDSDTPRGSQDPDREPLFRASHDDDEDDDDGRPTRPYDLENPPPRSRERSVDKPHKAGEDKSSGSTPSTTNVSASGSGNGQNIAMHAYPPRGGSYTPSLTSSVTTGTTAASRPSSASPHRSKRRRTPPPPLLPPSPLPAAINSPSLMTGVPHSPVPEQKAPVKMVAETLQPEVRQGEGDGWDVEWDESGDWAERVGEDEWTGRRMEERKGFVHEQWNDRQQQQARIVAV